MVRSLALIVLCFCSVAGFSQRKFLFGVVEDSVYRTELVGTHIRNISSDKLAISDEYGRFRITAQEGDSLVFSNVGYQQLLWIVKADWFTGDRIAFALPADALYLDEVVIREMPTYQKFKELVVKAKVEDTSYQVFGAPTLNRMPAPGESLAPKVAISGPFGAIHQAVSKKEKEKKKYQQLQRRKGVIEAAAQKFNREWVSESTKLEGEELTHFIAYCNFTDEYLAATPEYIILERMLAMLEEFKAKKSEG